MTAEPTATPVTCGLLAGTTAPSGMTTEEVTVTTPVSLLSSRMVVPPAGAGSLRLTGRLLACPGDSVGTVPTLTVLLVLPVSATASAYPAAEAVITALPSATPVTSKAAELSPALICTVDGVTVTSAVLLLARLIVRPPAGAGSSSTTVPGMVRPTPTSGSSSRLMVRSATVTVPAPDVNPSALAVSTAVPAAVLLSSGTSMTDSPAATATVDGGAMTEALSLARASTSPPGPAGRSSVTRRFPEAYVGRSRVGTAIVGGVAEIVTVAGVESTVRSLTSSVAAYSPARSGVKLGVAVVASASVAVEPSGPVRVQA